MQLWDISLEVLSIELIPLVCDFLEVFLPNLPIRTLNLDIHFCINTDTKTHPNSISP